MTAEPVDWAAYLTCDSCGAPLGKPCRSLSGFVPGAQGGVVEVPADEPHTTRKKRTGGVR